jgi:hypothetical protein
MEGLGFWLFIAICVVASAYSRTQQQRAKLELLRTSIEKGQPLDPDVIDKLLPSAYSSSAPNPQGLLIAGIIMFGVGVGLGVLAFFLSHIKPAAFWPVMGSGGLCISIGVAMCVAWKVISTMQAKQAGKPQ